MQDEFDLEKRREKLEHDKMHLERCLARLDELIHRVKQELSDIEQQLVFLEPIDLDDVI